MNQLSLTLTVFLTLIFLSSCIKIVKPPDSLPKSSSDYFSTQRFGVNFFNEEESLERLMAAKRMGVDFIRLTPSKWKSRRENARQGEFLIGDQNNYQGLYKDDQQELTRVLDLAHQAGLKVMLTFLNVPGRIWEQHHNGTIDCRLWRDKKFHKEVADFFADVIISFGKHPALVAINPINEPAPERCFHEPLDWADEAAYAQWHKAVLNTAFDINVLYQAITKKIRQYHRTIAIVFDSTFYSTPKALPNLYPINDPNVFYSFHMYEPYRYTFQKDAKSSYPGLITTGEEGKNQTYWDVATIKTFFKPIEKWRDTHGIHNSRIIVGEFGIDRQASGAKSYLSDLIQVFNDHSWHWAFYTFRENDFPKMDYEIGEGVPGWHYWRALEKRHSPNHRRYKSSELMSVIREGINKPKKSTPPPLGWNSWNWFGRDINEQIIEETIALWEKVGLKEAGYQYIVIDGGWAQDFLAKDGKLVPDPVKFPRGIKRLADLAHKAGLQLGLHVSVGTHNCARIPIGSYGNEAIHWQQLNEWGIDFIKLDQCFLHDSEDWPLKEKHDVYQKWRALSRDHSTVISMSAYGYYDWYPSFGDIGRTTVDIKPRIFGGATFNSDFFGEFISVMEAANINNAHHGMASNGYWNDPDLLVVGDDNLSFAEQQTHFALWAVMSAPLMLSFDIRTMDPKIQLLITDKEILSINQDTYQQGYRIKKLGDIEIWRKFLSDGSSAVLIINLNKSVARSATITDGDVEMVDNFFVKDIFAHKSLGGFRNKFSVTVPPNESKLYLISATRSLERKP